MIMTHGSTKIKKKKSRLDSEERKKRRKLILIEKVAPNDKFLKRLLQYCPRQITEVSRILFKTLKVVVDGGGFIDP